MPGEVWERRSSIAGIEFNLERQMRLLAESLAPYLPEFHPPLEPIGRPWELFPHNRVYGSVGNYRPFILGPERGLLALPLSAPSDGPSGAVYVD